MTYSVLILRKPGTETAFAGFIFRGAFVFYLPAAGQKPTSPMPTEKALKQFLPKAAV